MSERAHDFLPNFCANRTVFLIVLTVELLAFMLALATTGTNQEFWLTLALTSLFIQWVALSTTVMLCVVRRWLGRFGVFSKTLVVYGITLLSTIVASMVALSLADGTGMRLNLGGWQDFLLRNSAVSSIVCLVLLRYFYLQHLWRMNVQAETEARIVALQARIRPHFLFNSMNTIASMIYDRPQQAEQAVLDLCDLFRSSMRQHDRITLDEELKLARGYLNIEKLRLGDRLEVDWRLADDLPRDILIPQLILQPLLENAVYHGIETAQDGGTIEIKIDSDRRRLTIEVANSLPAPDWPQKVQRRGHGIAQENIRQRLALAYADQGGLTIEPDVSNYRVRLTIPRQVRT